MTSMGFDPVDVGQVHKFGVEGTLISMSPLQKFMLVVCICEYDIVI